MELKDLAAEQELLSINTNIVHPTIPNGKGVVIGMGNIPEQVDNMFFFFEGLGGNLGPIFYSKGDIKELLEPKYVKRTVMIRHRDSGEGDGEYNLLDFIDMRVNHIWLTVGTDNGTFVANFREMEEDTVYLNDSLPT